MRAAAFIRELRQSCPSEDGWSVYIVDRQQVESRDVSLKAFPIAEVELDPSDEEICLRIRIPDDDVQPGDLSHPAELLRQVAPLAGDNPEYSVIARAYAALRVEGTTWSHVDIPIIGMATNRGARLLVLLADGLLRVASP